MSAAPRPPRPSRWTASEVAARGRRRAPRCAPDARWPRPRPIAEVVRQALARPGELRGRRADGRRGRGGTPEERDELRPALAVEDLADHVHVTGDIEIALAAAFGNGSGIVVTAGTGSVAVARDSRRRDPAPAATAGRWATKAAATRSAARRSGAVGRAADGRSPATMLTTGCWRRLGARP